MKLKWTHEKCREEALKYNTKIDFKNNCKSAYRSALKNKWKDEICSHMINVGHKYKRCIYAFEFSNNYVYVGLTYNANKRKNEHLIDKNSQVYKYITLTKIEPIFYKLTDYIDVEEAKIKEEEFIKRYKKENWNILNKAKSGGLGTGSIFYSREKCLELALKYTKASEFAKNNSSAYSSAQKHKWLDEIYSHMENINHSPGYWTKENCQIEALKYKTRTEYAKNNMSAYNKSIKEKWIDDICKHMN
jgi:predicted GIY-YIG superfamily endonuclease